MTIAQLTSTDRARKSAKPLVVLAATILGSATVFIDTAVMTIALPVVQTEFEADLAELQWITEAYLLTLTALMLTGGALGDQLGRRRIFLIGIVLFAAASLWCGLSRGVGELLIARAGQGIGGALLVPGSLAILTHYFPKGERGRAIGIWSAFTSISVAFAPLLGGWMIDTLSWRWIFFINVPLGVVVVFLAFAGVPESRDESQSGKIDWLGALLATFGLGALVFALIEWGRLGPTHWLVLSSLVLGIVLTAGFFRHEARTSAPMLPLGLFRNRTFWGTNVATLLLYAGLSIVLFFMPIHLMHVRDYTATEAGAAMLPFILMLSFLSHFAGWVADQYGARLPITIGPIIAGTGFLLLGWPGLTGPYWSTYMIGMVVTGLGIALTVTPLTMAVMNAAPANRAGIASAINNAVSRLAFLLAVAVMGAIALTRFKMGLGPELIELLGDEVFKLGAARVPPDFADQSDTALAVDMAALLTFRLMMSCACFFALAAGAIGWLTVSAKSHPPRDPNTPVEVLPG